MVSWLRIIAIALLMVNRFSYASVVKLSDLSTMAKQSDVVIHGYVGDQRVTTDNLGRLVTFTDIEVIDGVYGAKTGELISIYQVGGEKNGEVMPLLGGHRYTIGQEVIFFGLKVDNAYVSYGAGQGKLDIIKGQNKELVVEDLGDVTALSPDPKRRGQVMRPMPLSFPSVSLTMDEIKEMIKAR